MVRTCKYQTHPCTAAGPGGGGASWWQRMGFRAPGRWLAKPEANTYDHTRFSVIHNLFRFISVWRLIWPWSRLVRGCPWQSRPSSCRTLCLELDPLSPRPERLPLRPDRPSPGRKTSLPTECTSLDLFCFFNKGHKMLSFLGKRMNDTKRGKKYHRKKFFWEISQKKMTWKRSYLVDKVDISWIHLTKKSGFFKK